MVSKSALLWYTFAVGYTRGLETKESGENENEKERFWQVAFAPEVAALQRERERERE